MRTFKCWQTYANSTTMTIEAETPYKAARIYAGGLLALYLYQHDNNTLAYYAGGIGTFYVTEEVQS